jgi:hypothetical protein
MNSWPGVCLPRSRGQCLSGPRVRAAIDGCRATLGITQCVHTVRISRFRSPTNTADRAWV